MSNTVWKKTIQDDLFYICELYGYQPNEVLDRDRTQGRVQKRRALARELHMLEYTPPQIGWAMRRDRTTINNLLKKKRRTTS